MCVTLVPCAVCSLPTYNMRASVERFPTLRARARSPRCRPLGCCFLSALRRTRSSSPSSMPPLANASSSLARCTTIPPPLPSPPPRCVTRRQPRAYAPSLWSSARRAGTPPTQTRGTARPTARCKVARSPGSQRASSAMKTLTQCGRKIRRGSSVTSSRRRSSPRETSVRLLISPTSRSKSRSVGSQSNSPRPSVAVAHRYQHRHQHQTQT